MDPSGLKPEQLVELYTLSDAVTRAARLEEIYQVALRGLQRTLGVDRAAILLFDGDGVMRFKAWKGLSEPYRRAVESHSPWPPDATDPQPVLVPDILQDQELAAFRDTVVGEGIRSLNFIPLISEGRLLGKLMLYYDEPKRFGEAETELAMSWAGQIAFAIVRQRNQDELHQSQTRLQRALDAGRMGTWDYDMATGLVVWSPQVEDIHGIPRGSFDGTFDAYTRDIHPDDRERVLKAIGESAQEGKAHDVEYRLVRPDGSVVWVHGKGDVIRDEDGRIVGLTGVCMDVTERKHRDLLLAGQKDVKERILHGAPLKEVLSRLALLAESQSESPVRAAVWLLSEEGSRLEIGAAPNLPPEFCQHVSSQTSSCADTARAEIVEDVASDSRWAGLAAAAESAGVKACWSLPMVALDGRVLGVFALYHPERRLPLPRDLQVMEVLSHTAAIAIERTRAQEDLLQAKEAADAASRAKSQFLANVSHEIRTPMNGIVGAVGLLRETSVTPDQAELLDMIRLCSEVLLTVINDVLDISKIEAGQLLLDPQPFDLAATVNECLALMREPASARGLQLELDLEEGLPQWVSGDAVRLRQVVLNLLNNAVKFTEQGRIRVRLRSRSCRNGKLSILMEVQDTGIGIPAEAQKRLFQPFSQVDVGSARRYGGTGLGLSISKQLVELMGGSIGVESQEGEGSRFWFTANFDVLAAPPAVAEDGDNGKASLPSSDLRILVAEDNPINLRVLLLQLRKLGYQADSAVNGQEALECLAAEDYDLVLMDCQMPYVDGYEVTRRVRSRNGRKRGPAIVALTAHALEGEREKCLEAGMDDYLRKPVSPQELQHALERWGQSAGAVSQR